MGSHKESHNKQEEKMRKEWQDLFILTRDIDDQLEEKVEDFLLELEKTKKKLLETTAAFVPGGNEEQTIGSSKILLYEKTMKFNEVARITQINNKEVEINPYDKSMTKNVEAALWKLNMGTVVSSSHGLILKLNPQTKENLQNKFKKLKEVCEELKNGTRLHKQTIDKYLKGLKDKPKDLMQKTHKKVEDTLIFYCHGFDQIIENFYTKYVA